MHATELANRVLDGLLSGFYGYSQVEAVLTRRNNRALDIRILSNSEQSGALNQILMHWLCLDSVMETIDDALERESSTPCASSLEIQVPNNREQALGNPRTVFHMLNERLVELHAYGLYPLERFPWILIAKRVEHNGC